jgi:hypothetical protein
MCKANRTALIVMVILVGLAGVCSAGSDVLEKYRARKKVKTAENKHPAAMELLDKYAETQDRIRSFALKADTSGDGFYTYSPKAKRPSEHKKIYTSEEVRFDGRRTSYRGYWWGDGGVHGQFVPRDEAGYKSRLWDGKIFFQYDRAKSSGLPFGRVYINKNESQNKQFERDKRTIGVYYGNILRGYFGGDQGERVDSVLRRANTISIRDKTEQAGGSDCFVIDAATQNGKYSLWIDPEHGYNIARAVIKRGPGDIVDGRITPQDRKKSIFLKNARFEKINDIWLPVEMDYENEEYFSFRDFYKSKGNLKVTDIVLNPDHEALNSFVPDDIENGARVYIIGLEGIRYTWRDGAVVDKDGHKVDLKNSLSAR